MRIAIISDTHMPRGPRTLPEACVEIIRASDLLLHAGDVSSMETLEMLRSLGPPLIAVHGNVDEPAVRVALPEREIVDTGIARIGMVHDAGPRAGRLDRMRRLFGDADAVIFGHSHIPLHERAGDGFQIFNPGSPTERRRAPVHTMGVADAVDGSLRFELIELPAAR